MSIEFTITFADIPIKKISKALGTLRTFLSVIKVANYRVFVLLLSLLLLWRYNSDPSTFEQCVEFASFCST
jgi:hypothetical protein